MNIEVNFDNLTKEEQEQFNALIEKANKPKSKVWKPKAGECEEYWYINHNGAINQGIFSVLPEHTERFSFGNCFKTREEAEFALERLKVIAEMKRYIAEHDDVELGWSVDYQEKWYIKYYHDTNDINIDYNVCTQLVDNSLYASSPEILENMIKEIGEDRIKKYYFGVE
jgi:hypothetical protein